MGVRIVKRCQLPEGFTVTNEMVEYAQERGWADPRKEFEAFKAYHLAHGSVMMNWRMALMMWCGKAAALMPSKKMAPLPVKQLELKPPPIKPEPIRHDPRVAELLKGLVEQFEKRQG